MMSVGRSDRQPLGKQLCVGCQLLRGAVEHHALPWPRTHTRLHTFTATPGVVRPSGLYLSSGYLSGRALGCVTLARMSEALVAHTKGLGLALCDERCANWMAGSSSARSLKSGSALAGSSVARMRMRDDRATLTREGLRAGVHRARVVAVRRGRRLVPDQSNRDTADHCGHCNG